MKTAHKFRSKEEALQHAKKASDKIVLELEKWNNKKRNEVVDPNIRGLYLNRDKKYFTCNWIHPGGTAVSIFAKFMVLPSVVERYL
jgi:hypothetical protein